MSLTVYKKLTKLDPKELGASLPELNSGHLSISSQLLSYAELKEKVSQFAPQAGWVMARGDVERSIELPAAGDLLEAEFCHGSNSLHLRLEGPGSYRCTQFVAEKTGDMVYREQDIFARETGGALLTYRLWWQVGTEGADEGRYRPFAQQFIGFKATSVKEAS